MKRFLQAKGRLRVGEMNRTEAAYRDYLEQQKNAGLILKYWFERFTWKIASNRCSYTPDFLVMRPDRTLELISLKYANGLRNGANSDTHRCKQLTEHGEERCIKLREVAGFSAVRTIFQIVGPRKILHCLLGK